MNMNRRSFIAALATAAAAPRALFASRGAHPAIARVGIQLYTMRVAARADMGATLRAIADAGFTEVELLDSMANLGVAAPRMRQLLDAAGLRAPSTHMTVSALDDMPRLVRDARTLGHEYVVVVSLPIDKGAVLDSYKRGADRLNAAGRMLRQDGLWLGFHNEPNDFTPVGGVRPYDVLLDALDPSAVRLQLDTGNAAMGGVDPLRYMTAHADRFWQFHLKDVPAIGAKRDTEIGTGVLDIRRIVALAGTRPGMHFYLEEEPEGGLTADALRRGYRFLHGLPSV